ncbi:MAG: DUF3096 domain-containing protein [Candidatus Pacearchaeota archaeon]
MVELILTLSALTAIVAGLIILIFPKIINYAIGIWLLIYGVLQIIPSYLS